MDEYLQATRLVGLGTMALRKTAVRLLHGTDSPSEAAVKIPCFVRDKIKFGYNEEKALEIPETIVSEKCRQELDHSQAMRFVL